MSVISASNNTAFKDSAIVISNVKRFLESFNAFNLLSEEEFYRHISYVINQLGVGVMMETDALIYIEGSKGLLPYNFKNLYAAYKTTPFFSHKPTEHLQDNSFSITRDVTQEIISSTNRCRIECCENDAKIIQKLTVKNYVNEGRYLNFSRPVLLRLSPNVSRTLIDQDSPCLYNSSPLEISIDSKYVYTNFDNDVIYMQYYGFPMNKDTGLPMIPNITSVEKAIEWYIIWQSLLSLWFNGEVSDIQAKWQKAEQEYLKAFDQAKYEVKLPTFQAMIEKMRLNRGSLSVYQM